MTRNIAEGGARVLTAAKAPGLDAALVAGRRTDPGRR